MKVYKVITSHPFQYDPLQEYQKVVVCEFANGRQLRLPALKKSYNNVLI